MNPSSISQASCAEEGTSNVKFHVVKQHKSVWVPFCGTGADGTTLMSHDTVPAYSVQYLYRCRRPACRKAFEAADAQLKGM